MNNVYRVPSLPDLYIDEVILGESPPFNYSRLVTATSICKWVSNVGKFWEFIYIWFVQIPESNYTMTDF